MSYGRAIPFADAFTHISPPCLSSAGYQREDLFPVNVAFIIALLLMFAVYEIYTIYNFC